MSEKRSADYNEHRDEASPGKEIVATEPEYGAQIETVEAESTIADQAPADESGPANRVPPPPAPNSRPRF